MLFMEDDDALNIPLVAGQVLQQSGSFTDASLNGVSVFEAQGLDTRNSPATPDAQVGFYHLKAQRRQLRWQDENDGGTMKSDSDSGTYSVCRTDARRYPVIGGSHPTVFYLIAKNQAFVLGTDGTGGHSVR